MNAVQPFITVENLSMSFQRRGSFFGRLNGEPVQLIRALNSIAHRGARGDPGGIFGQIRLRKIDLGALPRPAVDAPGGAHRL